MYVDRCHVLDIVQFVEQRQTSEPFQNCARLTSLLLEQGTALLVRYLTDKLTAKFGSLDEAFKSSAVQKALKNHTTGYDGSCQLFTESQHEQVKESRFDIEKVRTFDLTLVVNLLDAVILQGHSDLSNVSREDRVLGRSFADS